MSTSRASQLKITSKSRALAAFYRALLSVLMPTFAWVAPRGNRRALRAIGRALAWGFWKVRPKYERAVRRNVARVMGLAAGDARVRDAAYRMHYNHAYFWIDLFRYAGKPDGAIESELSYVRGADKLDAALAQGKGVILATAHVGNWELGGLLLGKKAYPVTVVYSRDRFAEIERFRSAARLESKVKELAVTDSMFSAIPLVQALRRGEIVALQADRDFNDTGIAVPFFGAPSFFPRGPLLLAAASGAPLLFCFILHEPGMRYGVTFDGPLPLASTGDREADVRENAARLAAFLEPHVRAHVDQWYCYYGLWDDAARRLAAAPAAT